MMNKYLELYLKAYTNKVAADGSIVDDAAVGVGSAAAGGLLGNIGSSIYTDNIFRKYDDRIERAYRKMQGSGKKYNEPLKDAETVVNRFKAELREVIKRGIEGNHKINAKARLKFAENKYDLIKNLQDSRFRTAKRLWDMGNDLNRKLQGRVKAVSLGSALGAGALGTLLYNRLNKD